MRLKKQGGRFFGVTIDVSWTCRLDFRLINSPEGNELEARANVPSKDSPTSYRCSTTAIEHSGSRVCVNENLLLMFHLCPSKCFFSCFEWRMSL